MKITSNEGTNGRKRTKDDLLDASFSLPLPLRHTSRRNRTAGTLEPEAEISGFEGVLAACALGGFMITAFRGLASSVGTNGRSARPRLEGFFILLNLRELEHRFSDHSTSVVTHLSPHILEKTGRRHPSRRARWWRRC